MIKRTEISPASIDRQKGICESVRQEFLGGRGKKAFVDTYGCQQNESDSEQIRGWLMDMGCSLTDREAEADVIVINTCAVREHAEQRILGNVGALNHTKKAKPDQIICLCGCMVQQPGFSDRIKKSYPIVDIVFGPDELWRFPELLQRRLKGSRRIFETRATDGVVAEGLPRVRQGGAKAWLSIMYGCNNFCTYCIVPYVRGRERSRHADDIVAEARCLVEGGAKDITLLGQNVNSYGKDLEGEPDFADLLRRINDIPGDFLIRFMTSHPKDATEKLFRAMAECDKVAHAIHLPVQSGSTRILKEMNRGYTREDYLEKVRLARHYMPDLVLTTDIIVGFPGETDVDFAETLSLVREVKYDAMFTFIYSKRTGTKAASLPDPFTREEKQVHFDALLSEANRWSLEKHQAYVGSLQRVLVDGEDASKEGILTSRTAGGRLVRFAGDPSLIGTFVQVKITGATIWALEGELHAG